MENNIEKKIVELERVERATDKELESLRRMQVRLEKKMDKLITESWWRYFIWSRSNEIKVQIDKNNTLISKLEVERVSTSKKLAFFREKLYFHKMAMMSLKKGSMHL